MARDHHLTGQARTLAEHELIVSKTNIKGRMTYVNRMFETISDYSAQECIEKPHSLIRHPDMPRAIFKLLWSTIERGQEIFAYVNNRCKNGDHYWVLAHVTPVLDKHGAVAGYHSNRRFVRQSALNVIEPLYGQLLEIESKAADRKNGLARSFEALEGMLKDKGVSYDRFILAI